MRGCEWATVSLLHLHTRLILQVILLFASRGTWLAFQPSFPLRPVIKESLLFFKYRPFKQRLCPELLTV